MGSITLRNARVLPEEMPPYTQGPFHLVHLSLGHSLCFSNSFHFLKFHFIHFLKLQDQRPEAINLCQDNSGDLEKDT